MPIITTKAIGVPRWTKGPWDARPDGGAGDAYGIYSAGGGRVGQAAVEADATLLASSPMLVEVLREYLESLEKRLAVGDAAVKKAHESAAARGKRYTTGVAYSVVELAEAKRDLEAAAPLYRALARAYGLEPGDLEDKTRE